MQPTAAPLVCSNCQSVNPPDARYCHHCGEPVSPDILRNLQRMYDTLKELDAAIGKGEGQKTIAALREQLYQRYTSLRAPQAPNTPLETGASAAAGAAPVTTPLSASAASVSSAPKSDSSPAAAAPHGPVFTWRAFIAEQAIAIMAYLGGFLLLIATLTFEVGGWTALPDPAKLAGVMVVYLLFGMLGMALRRVARLRTVSRVYLGVFALMTPLAALAVYRFVLQEQGFSQAGMVCLASAYAAVIYVALAARTRFATYAYLGWAAALVAAIAIPAWAQAPDGWWLSAMALAALALLIPWALGQRRPDGVIAWLATPALWMSAIAACAAGLIAPALLLHEVSLLSYAPSPDVSADMGSRLALAVMVVALTTLALAWSWTLRTFERPLRWELLTAIAWLIAAFAAMAAAAIALAFSMDARVLVYTLAATALAEGVITLAARAPLSRQTGLTPGVKGLAIALAFIAVLLAVPVHAPNYPVIAACGVGLALGLMFALSGALSRVVAWGIAAGLFALTGANALFAATTPTSLLLDIHDSGPDALLQLSSQYAEMAIGLAIIGVALRLAMPTSRARRLRVAAYVTALGAGAIAGFTLVGHTWQYIAAIMGLLAFIALAVGRIERQPLPAGIVAAVAGSISATMFVVGSQNALAIATLAPTLAVAALVIFLVVGRAYALPVYVVTTLATFGAFARLIEPPAGLPDALSNLALGAGGIMALVVASLMAVAALRARSALWQITPAAVALLSVFSANDLWPLIMVSLALAGMGSLCRWRRGPGWGAAWQSAAGIASIGALRYTLVGAHGGPGRAVALSLLFLVVAWLVARQERLEWLTVAAGPYALVAFWQIGALPLDAHGQLAITIALTLTLAGAGALARIRMGRSWALALYGMAVVGSLLTVPRVIPYPEQAGLLEAALLLYAAVAFAMALLEESPWAVIAPAAYAAGAALAQPDGRALLPLALGLAAAAFAVSRTRGARCALPLYGAAMVAAVASSWQSQTTPTFQPVALATLALVTWLLAALESRPDAILIAVTFAALTVPSAGSALDWQAWQIELAFAALVWVVSLSGLVWARIPWLRERPVVWLTFLARSPDAQAVWRDPHVAGRRVSRATSLLIGAAAILGGLFAPDAFATKQPLTLAIAIALLSLTGLLVVEGLRGGWRPALYLALETAALFVTWQLRWFGATNPQAWIIAPGSAQIIIGALLPADKHLRAPRWVGQVFSVAGALILTLPTLTQSITEPSQWQWVYALSLAVEALVLTLVAVGLRNRLLALTGSAFVGIAAIRGAIIAVNQNLPTPLVIGVFALALMGLATWLSLRSRHTGEGGDDEVEPGPQLPAEQTPAAEPGP